ncbi:PEP-CTERM sorting domain-containing protein [Agarivorans sp. 1_MG-2023]|uniref:Npun_F0296 family exosortase-dependent surface protein n=1 Tax=Agarivorans sp. 1_MG-2023 TaxID=3062634 RepID=UPI0026E25342|nr:PEP-CTERM sorting domain-containing protein [Agarivorans sp. 1_MG-2023]MDO6762778.1 PEP-CTERM sorting domain-containing protein [Agarivorans sp. 1_MG-2023]
MKSAKSRKLNQLTIGFVVIAAVLSFSSHAGIIYTIEAPGIQSSQVGGTLQTETFDSLAKIGLNNGHQTDFGDYSVDKGTAKVVNFGVYGGAYGEGKYLFIPNKSSVTLDFNQAMGYFGFWWSAGDSGNQLSITTQSESLSFVTNQILDAAVLEPEHYGSPTSVSGNKREPYGYVNLFAESEADKITSIQFFGRNFETDNHSASLQLQTITGRSLSPVTVPEPNTWWLVSLGLVLLVFSRVKRNRKA